MIDAIKIGIAEDHKLVRQGYVRMLNDHHTIKILFEADNGKELLKKLKEFKPAVILLDMAMPAILDGVKALVTVKQRYPKLKIIVISAHSDAASKIEFVKLGANSFLNKDCDVKTLIEAIHAVNNEGTYFDKETAKLLQKHGVLPPEHELTEREIVVLKLLCAKTSVAEIAELMDLEEKTVYWYKHKLLAKTSSDDLKDLISFAKKNEYIK